MKLDSAERPTVRWTDRELIDYARTFGIPVVKLELSGAMRSKFADVVTVELKGDKVAVTRELK